MKKLTAILLIFALLLSAPACGNENTSTGTNPIENSTTASKPAETTKESPSDTTNATESTTAPSVETDPFSGLVFVLNPDGESYELDKVIDKNKTRIVVPSEYEGKPVTRIGSYAFEYCHALTELVISEGIVKIDDSAITRCENLLSVSLPSTLRSIGNYAFYKSSSIEHLEIPENVTMIGEGAFDSDKLIVQEGPLSYVDGWLVAFDRSTTDVVVRDGTVGIANSVFINDLHMTSIIIPDSIKYMPPFNPFELYAAELGNEKDGIYYLGNQNNPYIAVIGADKSLTTVELADSTRAILDYAFFSCNNLTYNIKDGVSYLGNSQNPYMILMTSAGELTSVSIPSTILSIHSDALSYRSELTDIYYEGSMQDWAKLPKGGNWNRYMPQYTVHCTDGELIEFGET